MPILCSPFTSITRKGVESQYHKKKEKRQTNTATIWCRAMVDITRFIASRTAIQWKCWIKLEDVGASLVHSDPTNIMCGHIKHTKFKQVYRDTHSREWNVGSKINSPTYSVNLDDKQGSSQRSWYNEAMWRTAYRRLNLPFDRVLTWKGRDPMYSDEHVFSIIVKTSVTKRCKLRIESQP